MTEPIQVHLSLIQLEADALLCKERLEFSIEGFGPLEFPEFEQETKVEGLKRIQTQITNDLIISSKQCAQRVCARIL